MGTGWFIFHSIKVRNQSIYPNVLLFNVIVPVPLIYQGLILLPQNILSEKIDANIIQSYLIISNALMRHTAPIESLFRGRYLSSNTNTTQIPLGLGWNKDKLMKLHHFHYCIILVYPIEIDNQHPSLLLSINQADLRRNQHTDGKVLIRGLFWYPNRISGRIFDYITSTQTKL